MLYYNITKRFIFDKTLLFKKQEPFSGRRREMSITNEFEYKQFKKVYQKYLKNKPITKKEIKHLKNDNLYFFLLKFFCKFSFSLNYQKIIKRKEIKTAMRDRGLKRITPHLQFLIVSF